MVDYERFVTAGLLLVVSTVLVFGFLSTNNVGDGRGFYSASDNSTALSSGSILENFLSATSCSDEDYDTCYANTYDSGYDAYASAILLVDDYQYLDERNGQRLVEPSAGVRYECLDDQAYFVPSSDTDDVDVSADGSGLVSSEREISNDGFIRFGDFDVSNGFQIVCADHDIGDDGSWAYTWVSSFYDSDFKVVEDSDGDGFYDFEDDCPNVAGLEEFNGCPDTDGDGIKDGSDACPETGDIGFGLKDNGCPVENSKPVIDNLTVPSSVDVGESFTAKVSASDENSGQELKYYWSNDVRGQSAEYVFKDTGLQEVEVTVSDGFDNVSSSKVVDVVESEPSSPEQSKGFLQSILDFFGSFF